MGERGYTTSELARAIRAPEGTVHKWLAGAQGISNKYTPDLLAELGVSPR